MNINWHLLDLYSTIYFSYQVRNSSGNRRPTFLSRFKWHFRPSGLQLYYKETSTQVFFCEYWKVFKFTCILKKICATATALNFFYQNTSSLFFWKYNFIYQILGTLYHVCSAKPVCAKDGKLEAGNKIVIDSNCPKITYWGFSRNMCKSN